VIGNRLKGSPTIIGGIPLPSDTALFLTFIVLHVAAGLACVIAGVVAMLSRKQPGRHPLAGSVYYWALACAFVTTTGPSWARVHLTGMGASYILLITAFYVDNGPNLPLWRELPRTAFWFLPTLIGMPVLLNAFFRHPLARRKGRGHFAGLLLLSHTAVNS
jgi:p-aminobenzoyl-glutamate transporter AbgT